MEITGSSISCYNFEAGKYGKDGGRKTGIKMSNYAFETSFQKIGNKV
ncbi:MAG: hypothetical protein HFG70_09695 [Hungatella sp.]|nr:hypothetical protein [Hungatella sp.]